MHVPALAFQPHRSKLFQCLISVFPISDTSPRLWKEMSFTGALVSFWQWKDHRAWWCHISPVREPYKIQCGEDSELCSTRWRIWAHEVSGLPLSCNSAVHPLCWWSMLQVSCPLLMLEHHKECLFSHNLSTRRIKSQRNLLWHRYRITEGINLPFRVLPSIKELGRTRMEVNVKVSQLFILDQSWASLFQELTKIYLLNLPANWYDSETSLLLLH